MGHGISTSRRPRRNPVFEKAKAEGKLLLLCISGQPASYIATGIATIYMYKISNLAEKCASINDVLAGSLYVLLKKVVYSKYYLGFRSYSFRS